MLKKLACSLAVLSSVLVGQNAHAQRYTGHDTIPRLRGANMLKAADADGSGSLPSDPALISSMGGNLIRYELVFQANYSVNRQPTDTDIANWETWLQNEVYSQSSGLNTCISNCRALGMKVLIDMHTPVGGYSSGGANMFLYPTALYPQSNPQYTLPQRFEQDWAFIASIYHNEPVVWGYDLCNEPGDPQPAPNDWRTIALNAIADIRYYDNAGGTNPTHAIVFEPSEDWRTMQPLSTNGVVTPGVVYSFHTYGNTWFSYDLDPNTVGSRVWPDTTPDNNIENDANNDDPSYNTSRHDITDMFVAGSPTSNIVAVRDFQQKYNCQIFVGEFAPVRFEPGAAEFADEQVNYFESYGWDWAYTGCRDGTWNGYNFDVGPAYADGGNQGGVVLPSLPKTDIKNVLAGWMANDYTPLGNFNFLTPAASAGGYTYGPLTASWSMNPTAGVVSNNSAFGNPDSVTGNQCAFLQTKNGTPGVISQSFQWNPGASYVVGFNAANRTGFTPQTINIYVGGTVATNGTVTGGQLVGCVTPYSPGSPATSTWDAYSTRPFTVGQGSIPLTMTLNLVGSYTSGDQTAFIDHVTISQLPPSSLPLGTGWLNGTVIADSSDTQVAASAAFDGNTSSYFNSAVATNGWVGIDLGPNKTAILTHVYYFPRSDGLHEGDSALNMEGGVFEGSDDKVNWDTVPLATIENNDGIDGQHTGATAFRWCQLPVTHFVSHRYFRYRGPSGVSCNVAELRFYGITGTVIEDGSASGTATPAAQAFDGNYYTSYGSKAGTGRYVGIDLGACNAGVVNQYCFYGDSNPSRLVGSVFQGSIDGSNWNNMLPPVTIGNAQSYPNGVTSNSQSGAPSGSQWTTITIPTPTPGTNPYPVAYRYFRLYNPNAGGLGLNEIQFTGAQSHLLTGTNFNDGGGSGANNGPATVYDGNTSTFYGAYRANLGYTGIDLGANSTAIVNSVSFYPAYNSMIGGVFQGTNVNPQTAQPNDWTCLAPQLTTEPPKNQWTTLCVANPQPYRYLRYLDNAPNGTSHYCEVAEVKFLGY